MLFFYTLLLTSYSAASGNTGDSAPSISSLVTATSTETLSSGLGFDIHGQISTGTTTGFQEVGNDANAFTPAWWDLPKVADTLKFNLGHAGVKFANDDDKNKFVAAWIKVAKDETGPSIQKQMAFKKLIDDYNLRDYCSVSPKGKEVLWSGHVKNSVYSRGLKPARTPLETTKLAEALSETFGTEHYKKALDPAGAFVNLWLPQAADMFNAATLIYSLYMKPTGGILEVYTNQLKDDAVFYKTELPLLAFMKNVKTIRFLIMSPPTPNNGPPQQYDEIDVDISDLIGNLNSGKECAKRIMKRFGSLEHEQVMEMWKNDFNIKISGIDESHEFIDASEGTRKKRSNAAATYKMFFKNFKAPKRTETAVAEDQRQEIVVKTSLPQYITVPTAAMFVAGLMGMVGLRKIFYGIKRTQNLYTPLKGIEEI